MSSDKSPYRGRFAPSPTGPLHFGSLVSAVASYLQARHQGGVWLVRMEDLDKQREQPGAAQDILNTLEAFGLLWDETESYQSQRLPLYDQALEELRSLEAIYPCACSRKEIQQAVSHSPEDLATIRYPGTCRAGIPDNKPARALRLKSNDDPVSVDDKIQGVLTQSLNQVVGDFVLKRADGFFAYQLAVVVDDAEQGINEVVRGADLLDNTPRQIFLQRQLSLVIPCYAHVPIATDSEGNKLSKQTYAAAVDASRPHGTLLRSLEFLGQSPPVESDFDSPGDILDWATQHWRLEAVPNRFKIPV